MTTTVCGARSSHRPPQLRRMPPAAPQGPHETENETREAEPDPEARRERGACRVLGSCQRHDRHSREMSPRSEPRLCSPKASTQKCKLHQFVVMRERYCANYELHLKFQKTSIAQLAISPHFSVHPRSHTRCCSALSLLRWRGLDLCLSRPS